MPFITNEDYRVVDVDKTFEMVKKSRAVTNPARHFHPCWEVLYIVSGERTFFLENRKLYLKAGTFVCIKPGCLHRAINATTEICQLYNLYFTQPSSAFYQSVLPLLEKCGSFVSLPTTQQEQVEHLFERAGQELLGQNFGSDIYAKSLLSEIFVIAARESVMQEGLLSRIGYVVTPTEGMNPSVAKIIDYLNVHYRENISLREMSQMFGIAESYLSRCFHQDTHFTFVEYVNSLRVTKGCALLTSTSLSVSKISEDLGFGSVSQFGRCFKSLTGLSPLQYKKEMMGTFISR